MKPGETARANTKNKTKPRKKTKILTGLAAKQAIMRAICLAIERDRHGRIR